jgi:polysaccharide deacetylase family protein (PEP-CTERM system associated)
LERPATVGAYLDARGRRIAVTNALSVDLEDWFCVHNLSTVISRTDWESCELRVRGSTNRLLDLFEAHSARATFFVLGWIAERAPELVREVAARGHEIAVHGYSHRLLTQMSAAEFEEDLNQALTALSRSGVRQDVVGFRAPSFTITDKTWWALPILEKHGIRYDSSVFPIGFHPDYGVVDSPLAPYKISAGLYEFPLTCVQWSGLRLPCSGGGYFRMLPYGYTAYCLRRCNAEGRPAVFYIHPWEIDPGQPRVKLPWSKAFRHYYGLARTEEKLHRLLKDFKFAPVREVLGI